MRDRAPRYLAARVIPNKQVTTVRYARVRLLAGLPLRGPPLQTDHGPALTYAPCPQAPTAHPLDVWGAQQGSTTA